jgi:hypothetical protein
VGVEGPENVISFGGPIIVANNFFVSYDPLSPDQNIDDLIKAIAGLGEVVKVSPLLWYIKSNRNFDEAVKAIRSAIPASGKALIINAKRAEGVNLEGAVSDFLLAHWNL